MRTIRFGIIGGGLMGKEFASAAARWCHLIDPPARPEIVALASASDKSFGWFRANFPAITQYTTDYQKVLANKDVDAVYIAVPHHLHRAPVREARHARTRPVAGLLFNCLPRDDRAKSLCVSVCSVALC